MGNEITRVEALESAINGDLTPEVVEKLTAMLEQLRKPAKRTETKEDRERAALVEAAVAAVKAAGEPVNAKWVTENVNGITTTQKAGAIMRIAIQRGMVSKTYDNKGKPVYSA